MKKALIFAVLLAAGAGGYYWYGGFAADAEGLQLVTAQVVRGDVVQGIDATGRLEALNTVQVGSQVSGTIKALYADFNTQVKSGQVVAELEPSLFETQVEQAEANLVRVRADIERARVQLEDARQKLERARELTSQNLLPMQDLETAEANFRTAQASLKSSEAQLVQAEASVNQNKVNLSHTVIRTPIDGVVISRNVDVGQTVAASMQAPVLFEIANDLTRMQVSASIDEADIGQVSAGQPVHFTVDAYPGAMFRGTVRQVRLNPVIESNVVSYVTVIDVPNPDLRLKPGMTANVTVEVARADNALRVPPSALRFTPGPEVFAMLGQEPVGAAPALAEDGPSPAPGRAGRDVVASRAGGDGDAQGELPAIEFSGGRGAASPEQREAFRARLAQMSPEERAAVAQRGGRGGRGGRAGARAADAGADSDARRTGVVWVLADGRLQPVQVTTGVSDGAYVAISGDGLQEGAVVVTGVIEAPEEAAAAPAQGNANPLMPQFGRGRFGGRGRGN